MSNPIIGREAETEGLLACLSAQRHVLLEGPVGVGKTALARSVCAVLERPLFRVDGDGRYSESKLVGHFDPPAVLANGYRPEHFVPGPLTQAMLAGGVLFINELNRMPEGVQNVLLPALDEGQIFIPNFGEVHAQPGFALVATQNPAEFVATGALSEALLDRFEWVCLDYQDEDEERAIVTQDAVAHPTPDVVAASVALVRATRHDPRIRRGASVRAAIAVADIATKLGGDVVRAAQLALPTRIELVDPLATPVGRLLDDLAKKAGVVRPS